ncbi:MAG: phospho-N-acetylmuramoyl-pentapeptide-transferase [Vampirovibrionales bacterium]|nr:phospho-N-acetylmuramoyl-pentapeptide-transferase [Vampirovibrionales bacterium]
MTVSLLAALMAGGPFIRFLRQRYLGQYIRQDGPQSHHGKAGTPTAGGVLILGSALAGIAAMAIFGMKDYWTTEFWLTLAVTFALGAVGFVDDYLKIAKKQNKGLSGYAKLAIQGALGLGIGLYMSQTLGLSGVAVFNGLRLELGPVLYPLFTAVVMMAVSNAVNLTDGLDGLAAGCSALTLTALSVCFTGNLYSDVANVYPDLGMAALILTGATLGFLFHNLYPARLFMGDTGSLALGGAMAAMAILSQTEFWLFLLGGVFVAEALSVILQVASFKLTGRRIFKMSPLHHHFELCGWRERRVTAVFVLTQFLLCALALFLYNK